LLCVVALVVSVFVIAPAAAATDGPSPDPSLDVRPDPAPVHSPASAPKRRPTPVQEKAAPTERSSSAPTQVTFAKPTAQLTPGRPLTTRSRAVPASRPRTSTAARATRPHERARRTNHAAAIVTLRRLAPLLAMPRLLRPAARSTPSGGDSGAQLLLFAGLALLLLVAASASLIRLTTRLSGDVGGERGP
jgi:hypothetical protein